MEDLNFGKGVYIWQPNTIEGGDPDRIAARLKLAGTETAAVKICDGVQVLGGLEALIQTLRNNQIRVGAWGYSYLNRAPLQEANVAAQACHRYSPDFYLIDVEAEVEGNPTGAHVFMNALRPATAGLPLGLNSFWNVRLHPTFPWAAFLEKVDFVCPQVYWRGVDPVGKLRQSQQDFANVPNSPEVPMPVVAGDMFTDVGRDPTPEQVTEFLAAADADPFIHGVLMWAADDTQTTAELWQAFSVYQWKKTGAAVTAQPLGWAKIKTGAGLWIRSAPLGAKVGSLARAELAPLWRLTETKWAAITKAGDRWIYVGDSDLVEVTLDTSAASPTAAPEISASTAISAPTSSAASTRPFQARVVARNGLNVRDRVEGTVMRVLAFGSLVQVYEQQNGWGRIHPTQSEWVSAAYLAKLA